MCLICCLGSSDLCGFDTNWERLRFKRDWQRHGVSAPAACFGNGMIDLTWGLANENATVLYFL